MKGLQNAVVGDEVAAARRGDRVWGRVSEFIPGAAQIVMTTALAPNLVYNVQLGEKIMVASFEMAITTLSDSCWFELGYTGAIDGGGTFYPITNPYIISTGAALDGYEGHDVILTPPHVIKYALGPTLGSGARSITVRMTGSDAAVEVNCSWHGWRERA